MVRPPVGYFAIERAAIRNGRDCGSPQYSEAVQKSFPGKCILPAFCKLLLATGNQNVALNSLSAAREATPDDSTAIGHRQSTAGLAGPSTEAETHAAIDPCAR